MSRPIPLLKQAAMARGRPGADLLDQHQHRQLSLFADPAGAVAAPDDVAALGLDVLDEQRRQEDAWHARQGLLRAAQLRLAAQRLWGFPNLVRNPDGPWQSLRGRACDLQLSRQCWPAYYLVRAGAAAVLGELAPVSAVACTALHPRHEAS